MTRVKNMVLKKKNHKMMECKTKFQDQKLAEFISDFKNFKLKIITKIAEIQAKTGSQARQNHSNQLH